MARIDKYPGQNNVTLAAPAMRITDLWFDSHDMKQTQYARQVLEFIYEHPSWVWIRPSHRAPWHWTTRLATPMGYFAQLNIWPHKAKWQVDGFAAVVGIDKLRADWRGYLDQIDNGDAGNTGKHTGEAARKRAEAAALNASEVTSLAAFKKLLADNKDNKEGA